MACEYRLTLALLEVSKDAETIGRGCLGVRNGELGLEDFLADVEELVWKISQRVAETTSS